MMNLIGLIDRYVSPDCWNKSGWQRARIRNTVSPFLTERNVIKEQKTKCRLYHLASWFLGGKHEVSTFSCFVCLFQPIAQIFMVMSQYWFLHTTGYYLVLIIASCSQFISDVASYTVWQLLVTTVNSALIHFKYLRENRLFTLGLNWTKNVKTTTATHLISAFQCVQYAKESFQCTLARDSRIRFFDA